MISHLAACNCDAIVAVIAAFSVRGRPHRLGSCSWCHRYLPICLRPLVEIFRRSVGLRLG